MIESVFVKMNTVIPRKFAFHAAFALQGTAILMFLISRLVSSCLVVLRTRWCSWSLTTINGSCIRASTRWPWFKVTGRCCLHLEIWQSPIMTSLTSNNATSEYRLNTTCCFHDEECTFIDYSICYRLPKYIIIILWVLNGDWSFCT